MSITYFLTAVAVGESMETGPLLEKIAAIKQRTPLMPIAVAGGLGPNTLHLVEPILRVYPSVSVDAQGRLRRKRWILSIGICRVSM